VVGSADDFSDDFSEGVKVITDADSTTVRMTVSGSRCVSFGIATELGGAEVGYNMVKESNAAVQRQLPRPMTVEEKMTETCAKKPQRRCLEDQSN
jgi:hypothetical protein